MRSEKIILFGVLPFLDANELLAFRSCIGSVMVRLRCLRFVLYLPVKTKVEEIDLYWFDLSHDGVEYEIDGLLILYTVPYPLSSQRQVYNHSFGRHSTLNKNINDMEWIIDWDSSSFHRTLNHFQYVRSIVLFVDIQVNTSRAILASYVFFICFV